MWKLFLTTIALVSTGITSSSEPSAPVPALMDLPASDSARYLVRVKRAVVSPVNVAETLDVTVETYGWPFAAVALKIGTNSPYIDIIAVNRGEIIDSCHWEYFRADRVKTENKQRYPKTLWSVIGLAKFSPDTLKPICLGLQREASIIRLVIASAPGVLIRDTTAAIFFLWEDCRDNTLSDASGATLLVSNRVFDYFDSGITPSGEAFPTRLGTPEQCINPGLPLRPRRIIEFHNGGLEFKVIQPESASGTPALKTD
jgi:hypothetical protein